MSSTEMGPGLESDSYIFGKEREFARHNGIRLGKKRTQYIRTLY